MIQGAKVDTINVIDLMIMAFTLMWLYDNDDDDDSNDDNENDMNDDYGVDDDDDP